MREKFLEKVSKTKNNLNTKTRRLFRAKSEEPPLILFITLKFEKFM